MFKNILAEIDLQIKRLEQAKSLLSTGTGTQGTSGRTRNSGSAGTTTAAISQPARKRRPLSAKARKAIGDAQRKRWAKVKGKKQ